MDKTLLVSDNLWSDWRLNPITQKFMEYLRVAKYDIARQKMAIISGPTREIDPDVLSQLNGMESILSQLLTLKAEDLSNRLSTAKQEEIAYKQAIKDNLGVEL